MIAPLIAALALTALPQDKPFPSGPVGVPSVTDVYGQEHTLSSKGGRATVLLFIAVDCPISNRYAPEIGRIVDEYSRKRIQFFRVYADPDVKTEIVDKHGNDFKLNFPAIIDKDHKLVAAVGASVTPQAAVIGTDGTLVYRGRIDDLYLDHGKFKEDPSRRDLRIALDEVLARKPVSVKQTLPVGCAIPDLER